MGLRMPPKGRAGRRSPFGWRRSRDSGRRSGIAMGAATAPDEVWAHVEYALPGRQRRDACGLGPEEIMSYPHGAERGRNWAGRMAVE